MKIIHVLRAPVGGLFRHVVDLTQGQIERGHDVGLIVDSGTGDHLGEKALRALEPKLALGLCRIPIARKPGLSDAVAIWRAARQIRATEADVVHGHGAKGGALARLVPTAKPVLRAYTPHGGSLHDAVGGRVGILLERMLRPFGHVYLFESEYSHGLYRKKVGAPPGISRVVHNGLHADEFEPIALDSDAGDLVYLGEMRRLKGVDLLLESIAELRRRGHAFTATLIGDGPDAAEFRTMAGQLRISDLVRFRAPMPARQGFALGRVVVLPSRAESLPYAVLEAVAAGKVLVTTKAGGIREIFGPFSDRLVPPGDVRALTETILGTIQYCDQAAVAAAALRERIRETFSVDRMVDSILGAYWEAGALFRQPLTLSAPKTAQRLNVTLR
ncbi:MAG TPA: glycosyltransferase family 4 protein [Xanthobacteraceae bacterium]|nr:glycosyltransferase family 4 protein [Xanthobacteraceae bacterium]